MADLPKHVHGSATTCPRCRVNVWLLVGGPEILVKFMIMRCRRIKPIMSTDSFIALNQPTFRNVPDSCIHMLARMHRRALESATTPITSGTTPWEVADS